MLSPWPLRRKQGWLTHVNQPLTDREQEALQRSIQRGSPFGNTEWTAQIIKKLGLESTVKPRGRPRKSNNPGSIIAPNSGSQHTKEKILNQLRKYLEANPNASGTVKITVLHPEGKGPCRH